MITEQVEILLVTFVMGGFMGALIAVHLQPKKWLKAGHRHPGGLILVRYYNGSYHLRDIDWRCVKHYMVLAK